MSANSAPKRLSKLFAIDIRQRANIAKTGLGAATLQSADLSFAAAEQMGKVTLGQT